jgi:hypothetical protein
MTRGTYTPRRCWFSISKACGSHSIVACQVATIPEQINNECILVSRACLTTLKAPSTRINHHNGELLLNLVPLPHSSVILQPTLHPAHQSSTPRSLKQHHGLALEQQTSSLATAQTTFLFHSLPAMTLKRTAHFYRIPLVSSFPVVRSYVLST